GVRSDDRGNRLEQVPDSLRRGETSHEQHAAFVRGEPRRAAVVHESAVERDLGEVRYRGQIATPPRLAEAMAVRGTENDEAMRRTHHQAAEPAPAPPLRRGKARVQR